MYTQEQANQMINDILGNLNDQGKVSEILQDFRTDYTGTLTEHAILSQSVEDLTKNNESLKTVNNKIMLQLGDVSTIVGKEKEQKEEQEKEEQENELTYENLFNEKGELK
jgi:regulator of replication initiation timing